MLPPHRLRRPHAAPSHRPPLLILLHGKGSSEVDLFQLADLFDPRFIVLSLRAPFQNASGLYRWYERQDTADGSVYNEEEVRASRLYLVQAINDSVMALGADPQQVYLFGFSQGAAMAMSVALTAPRRIRGLVAIAGRLLPAIAPFGAPAESMSHLRVLLQHGLKDEVVPFAESATACQLFAELSVKQGIREYAAGHTITPAMLRDARQFLRVQLDTTLVKDQDGAAQD
ncbi:alpha/beta hydrolase [Uliginosibacterium sp. H1]|uniref:alpha/beta hydrolase n=1 Tax=Uliginosibacterium sp. H1 TaxID=3114757 RepID=UPI002E1940E9|nr:alpha/beta fold hydrolase [Uliginosibacterium sp. H1]